MSDTKKSTFTWGGARPGAGRPNRRVTTAASPARELSVVELVREPEARGAIVVTTPQGVRIEGMTFEQDASLARRLRVILSPSRAVRVFAYPAPVDLRKGYDGLYGLAESGLEQDPMSGDLFLFVNELRKLCKVLVWDGSGLCIFQKRLAKGTFAKRWPDDDQVLRLTQSELALFIEGSTLLDRRSLSPIVVQRKAVVSDRAV